MVKKQKKPKAEDPAVHIIAYNGFDSAASAAILLGRHADAQIYISSAARVAKTLARIEDKNGRVHILGLGARCEIEDLREQLAAVSAAGGAVTWYCKGTYLDELRECFDASGAELVADTRQCLPEIVRRSNGIDTTHASKLVDLTRKSLKEAKDFKHDWIDLVNSSINRFFRYQDYGAVTEAIRKLADPSLIDPNDMAHIRNFRRWGNRFLSGRSEIMARLRELIMKIAKDPECSVLVTGETGTGKELAAQMLHQYSPRSVGPFFTVNCASFDNDLTEDSLFGHEKGAFTSAGDRREGVFEAASGGTLFLDEIGGSHPALQAKLLRVLETRTVYRLGSNEEIPVDVRVVFATNKDLKEEIRRGRLRDDLYYRISKIHVEMPPLRDHIEDIEMIANEILHRFAASKGQKPSHVTRRQLEVLKSHTWPGNVRELEGVLERVIIFEESNYSKLIDFSERKTRPPSSVPAPLSIPKADDSIIPLKEHEQRYVRHVYELFDRNKTRTAKALGITVNTLKKKLQE